MTQSNSQAEQCPGLSNPVDPSKPGHRVIPDSEPFPTAAPTAVDAAAVRAAVMDGLRAADRKRGDWMDGPGCFTYEDQCAIVTDSVLRALAKQGGEHG